MIGLESPWRLDFDLQPILPLCRALMPRCVELEIWWQIVCRCRAPGGGSWHAEIMQGKTTNQSLAMRVAINDEMVQRKKAALARRSHNIVTPFALFVIATIYWETWLVFYGIARMWGSFRTPGSHEWVVYMNWVWMDAPHVLPRLTACLEGARPNRNATVADFTSCLRNMGME
jgi:hypothetical protein